MVTVNIFEQLVNAFGQRPKYVFAEHPAQFIPDFPASEVFTDDEIVGRTLMGTPVFDRLTVAPGVTPAGISYAGYTFPDAMLMEVTRAKRIVETAVAGRDGTVKEYIGMEDYSISMRGLLVADTYPYSDIQAMRILCELPAALSVQSRFLAALGIESLVIRSVAFEEMEAFENMATFRVTATADFPVEFQIIEEEAQ